MKDSSPIIIMTLWPTVTELEEIAIGQLGINRDSSIYKDRSTLRDGGSERKKEQKYRK